MADPLMDKREYPRVEISHATAEVSPDAKGAVSPELCRIVNLSQSGMLFKANRVYEAGQPLLLSLRLSESSDENTLRAIVVHAREETNGKFIGVKFHNIEAEFRDALRHYIRSALGESVGLG